MSTRLPPDRARDITQPLEALNPNERLKERSRFLRGTIAAGLTDPLTGSICEPDTKLVKFHGIYMQDDRDLREERRRQMLEPDYQFMVRVRLPGGVLSRAQWLALDAISRTYANGTLRLTTRQTFQFHGIIKTHLAATITRLDAALLDTIAACGDDCRGVMCSVIPRLSKVHRQVHALAERTSLHMRPRTRAYREIWLGDECVASGGASGDEEPFYGPTYLPRKFKIGFVVPPVNDIDVFTQDLGFIAIIEGEELLGFDVCVGGGMGRTDRAPHTYPRLADVIGFVTPDKVLEVSEQVAGIQRDYGDRVDRSRARFKYTLDTHGLPWFRAELHERLGFELAAPRPYHFETNSDRFGWQQGSEGEWHLTLFVENGRIQNADGVALMDGLRALARDHELTFRLTPNQNLVLSDIADGDRIKVEALLARHGVSLVGASRLRMGAMACVALPTCGLAMAESERYLPSLVTKLDAILSEYGLSQETIRVRMTGCPNGCARPYVAEIGLTGRAPGRYNLYLGGGTYGQRLSVLHAENVDEVELLGTLVPLIERYAAERSVGEAFGDFLVRADLIRPADATSTARPRAAADLSKETPEA